MHLTHLIGKLLKPQKKQQLPSWSTLATSPILVVLTIASLTGTMGQRYYSQPKLDEGTVAPQTIRAPKGAIVPDNKVTEQQRKSARLGDITVLMINESVNQRVDKELAEILALGNQVREIVVNFPFVNTGILSTNTQLHLQQVSQEKWVAIQQIVEEELKERPPGPQPGINADSILTKNSIELVSNNDNVIDDRLLTKVSVLADYQEYSQNSIVISSKDRQAISELLAYRKKSFFQNYERVLEEISQARDLYKDATEYLAKQQEIEGYEVYDSTLLELSDTDWQKTQTGIEIVKERMLAQGISPNLPKQEWVKALKLQVNDVVPVVAEDLAINVLKVALEANLSLDSEGTKQSVELAAQEIETVTYKVRKNEVIVRKGKNISRKAFVLLDHFRLSRRTVNWHGLGVLVGIVSGAVGIVVLVERQFKSGLRHRDNILLLLLSLSAPLLIALKVPWSSLPAIGLLVGTFYGSTMGVTVVGLISVILPIGMDVDKIDWFASAAGAIVGSVIAEKMRSREEQALLGLGVGLTQGTVYLLINLIVRETPGLLWYAIIGPVGSQAVTGAVTGLVWSIVALGLSPYLEHLFDLITSIRLSELANPNRPLLKRLASEAPGTFQHTLFVASLAEAAARAIGCNVELVRTGTLYHDIGKMHDPLGFIENQMGGPNKHDEIKDPWVSVEIIRKHVTEGLVMARKHRLPKAIRAFIPEHQGTMLIAYFYYQAKQRSEKGEKVVKEEMFRYAGPIPQSRETAIVMLADSCEAALRSLKDVTHKDALQMVKKIMRARWQDNQLADSGLTRAEMSTIAEIFVQVWEQYNHKRIAYPKAAMNPNQVKTVKSVVSSN
ncbi:MULTISPECIES: HD family phosphohydrolase [unclassified Okeania]|uniref:HD family phosphohydrolase n=1 Tax=unclassified Okeania TaxID=2634635 RepID=UPI0013BA2D87|nr:MULTISPECIES: HDIG domain-containing metalloprotein [unclassified Okeania]NES78447.1 HDIG domain-containing protein [Okeania sp. SIO1H4]NET15020.1 HDIG domain-containing protein [Okeania sp. SIO1H6]NET21748.1 HDIG domain-containing protein [Okeania sp. SIO1H5]NET96734.1 HDIG domain-containing protein [Okeania sp. SIO1H2]